MMNKMMLVTLCVITAIPCVFCLESRGQELRSGKQNNPDAYVISLDAVGSKRREIEAAARNRIWEHWNQHLPDIVEVIRFSKEGERTQSKFVLSKSADGRSVIHIHVTRQLINRRDRTSDVKNEEHDAFSLTRIGAPKSPPLQPANEQSKSLGNWVLVFKDQHGNSVAQL